MADYNQLNNAHLSKFDVIFSKNKEISNAILELVRTAYEDHHEEDKERRKKLVQCLQKRCNIIVDQLSDDTFKDKLKEKISSIVQNDKGFTSELKKQIEEDLHETVEEVSEEQEKTNKTTSKIETKKIDLPPNSDLIDKVFSNKKFVKNITDFTQSFLNKNNSNRLKVLDKLFNKKLSFKEKSVSSSKRTQRKDTKTSQTGGISGIKSSKDTNTSTQINNDLVKKVTGGFGWLIKSFIDDKTQEKEGQKTLTRLFQEKLSEKISGTIKYLKHVKYKSLRGFVTIKKNLNPKGLFKLTGFLLFGTIKIFKTLVFGLFKGLFSLVKGIFKIGLNVVKASFKVVTGVVSSIFKVSKKITKGLKKLTAGFLSKLKWFLLTPKGAYLTGFVIGFVVTKIKNAVGKAKEWISDKFEDIRDKLHQKRMDLIYFIRNDEKIKQLKKLMTFQKNMSSFKVKIGLLSRDLDQFTSGGAIGSLAGSQVGAIMGKVIGTAIAALFPPLAPILPGIGVALGAVAGYYIGEAFGSIKEEDYYKNGQKNNLLREITLKYRNKRKSKVNKVRSGLQNRISAIDNELKNKSLSKEQRQQLENKRKEYQASLSDISEITTIDDEDPETRSKRQKKIDEILKLLNLEQSDGLLSGKRYGEEQSSIFIFPEGRGEEVDYSTSRLFKETGGLSPLSSKLDRHILQAFKLLSRIKVIFLGNAIDAYQRGQIPFDKIQSTADEQIGNFINGTNLDIQRWRSATPGASESLTHTSVTLKDYLDKPVDYGAHEIGHVTDANLKQKIESDTKQNQDNRNKIIDDLTEKYINYAIGRGGDADYIRGHEDIIGAYMGNFVAKNNITGADQITGDMQQQLWNSITTAITIPDVDIEEEGRRESLREDLVKSSLKTTSDWKAFTKEQNKQYGEELEKALIELGLSGDEEHDEYEDRRITKAKVELAESKAKYRVKFAEAMGKRNRGVAVAVPVEKKEEEDYTNANSDSGLEGK